MNPHEALLVLCTYQPLSEDERRQVLQLATQTTDWATFGALAQLNKVEPKVYLALRECGALELVPQQVRELLGRTAAQVQLANERRIERARQLFPALVERGIPVCVLKGVLFAETIYRAPGYKRMNDVDFLVPKADLSQLPALYEQHGFFSIAERVGHRAEVQTKVSHHLAPYVSRDLSCVLGTQWGLKSPLLGLRLDLEAMWRRARPFDFYGIALQQLSPTDNLVHVCLHLGLFKSGLRDVMDIYNLARVAGDDLDYARFTEQIREAGSGASDLAYHSLSLANALCPLPQFERVLGELEPAVSSFMVETVKKKTASRAVQLRLCSGYLGVIEKAITDFNASESAPEKLNAFAQFWKLVLLPTAHEARQVCFEPLAEGAQQRAHSYRAPVAIVRAIGAEIGGPLLALLLVKGTVDVALTALNPWAWKRSDARNLAAFAARQGLSLVQLQQLKDSIF